MTGINETKWDVIVIGSGFAGLTASIFLAKAGHRVLLLERAARLGGRAGSTEMSGARVNLGPHAIYKSASDILQEVGVVPTGGMPKPNALIVYKQTNGEAQALPILQLLLGSLLKWPEKTQLIRFYAQMRKEQTSTLQSISLQHYLETRLPSPRVRHAILALVRTGTYCQAADLISAGAALAQLREQVLYADGGWESIVHQLRQKAQDAGVILKCNSSVRSIKGTAPEMEVHVKDGSTLKTRRVLSTVGPQELLSLLDPALQPEEAEMFKRLIPVHAACLDVVMDGMPKPKTTFAIGADYPWYFSNHSAVAKLTCEPQHSVVHVMKYLRPGTDSNAKQDEQELEQFMELVQPGWTRHVMQRRFLPRILVAHAVVAAANGGYAGRPGTEVKARKGLYLAGDWVGPEGMLVKASLASAKSAALSIMKEKG
ncbi:phytoene desaturase family protein [Paenibacillus harenae]|uniref:phytoene desaturase family protein n=1 Tax=Paenibacillus harenae TaxID=306543 RepID=UPI0004097E1F|nr:FAD-dependent oxidoreductase [Paenibacillus harenae]